jgi:hypothetical protein
MRHPGHIPVIRTKKSSKNMDSVYFAVQAQQFTRMLLADWLWISGLACSLANTFLSIGSCWLRIRPHGFSTVVSASMEIKYEYEVFFYMRKSR